MEYLDKLTKLNNILIEDMPQYKHTAEQFESTPDEQRRLLRSLMNIRPALPLSDEFLSLQDEVLRADLAQKGVVELCDISPTQADSRIHLWQGDITRLEADAIVNAANSALLGCFIPCHGCIDNAIHSCAGLQLRRDCHEIMQAQAKDEPIGGAKITPAYSLPSKYVIHTVGPIISGKLADKDRALLRSCYEACLRLAISKNLASIAFCCISTGEFHFPNDVAAQIAIQAVSDILAETNSEIKVVFNVFKQIDYDIYRKLLGQDRTA